MTIVGVSIPKPVGWIPAVDDNEEDCTVPHWETPIGSVTAFIAGIEFEDDFLDITSDELEQVAGVFMAAARWQREQQTPDADVR